MAVNGNDADAQDRTGDGHEAIASPDDASLDQTTDDVSGNAAAMQRQSARFRFQRRVSAIIGIVALAIGYLVAVKFAIALF